MACAFTTCGCSLDKALPPGHVLKTLCEEHDMMLGVLLELTRAAARLAAAGAGSPEAERVRVLAERLIAAEPHHQREEQVLFPELEARGILGPPEVMRREHEGLRVRKHAVRALAVRAAAPGEDGAAACRAIEATTADLAAALSDHIAKENRVLFPMAFQVIGDAAAWDDIRARCDAIGYLPAAPAETERGQPAPVAR